MYPTLLTQPPKKKENQQEEEYSLVVPTCRTFPGGETNHVTPSSHTIHRFRSARYGLHVIENGAIVDTHISTHGLDFVQSPWFWKYADRCRSPRGTAKNLFYECRCIYPEKIHASCHSSLKTASILAVMTRSQ